MEGHIRNVFFIVCALVAALGCEDSSLLAPEEPGTSDYFPIAACNKWTYTDGKQELNLYILRKRPTHVEGFKTWVFIWSDGPRQWYGRSTQQGLYLYTGLDSPRRIHVLKYPPRVGTVWTAYFEYHVNARYRAVERVVVPAGAFDGCLLLEVLNPAQKVIYKGWFKPHVGFVRVEEIGGFNLLLVDYVLNSEEIKSW